ncbi:hypothetical protein [Mesorhizobium sp.]|uniref:hypothetical protein n=1 Tax=Mesorhizobium sp. TaxID=1871066 RepID=UPI000FE8C02D|nr:hypothetical protein [Mesorhizobium sp.]RWE56484.1 MAG: hypothetical protein EOS67_19000 [Mesorhizobium sp.]
MLKNLALAAATAVALGSSAFAAPRVERVTFASHGEQIVGDLYLPEDLDPARPRPALVVTGAWMTIKEQMPARYAREMADRGFAALTFDKFYARLTGPKQELWLDNVTQFDFYDRAALVKAASDAVAAHFSATLGGAGEAGQ